ncbi:MAG TPA: YbhB/YbcL family Raf kinase inhibitor-like protein [Burkholderiaceae bacterium]|nr:YbhB/YbcL family Raf kinase inhibitor-like protein [Burkholderiaceae bacterium]HQR71201.1 YbhB/YbcL family Raf kinase inhibitor-like protein [Burkholderiaceae bacterium]
MQITSPAFHDHGSIPREHTCEGNDVSPPLVITGVPAGTKGLALIVDDPDAPDPAAPKMTWVHWVLYDLPPQTAEIPSGASGHALQAHDGINDWKRTGYGGPCPPIGRHRYFFKLFALDRKLGDLHRPTSAQLQRAFSGHVLAEAQLVGLYAKQR